MAIKIDVDIGDGKGIGLLKWFQLIIYLKVF